MSLSRRILERVSRGVALRRRFPPDLGGAEIFVSPECGLRYWKRNLADVDPELFSLAREFARPGQTVWDIGANVGIFTFACAGMIGPGGKVVCFEPDLQLVKLLRQSAASNAGKSAEVQMIPTAVSDQTGFATFDIAKRSRASNALENFSRSTSGGIRESHTVSVHCIDDLLQHLTPPQLVKIDVEGAEANVLAGGGKLLEEIRPIIICEVGEAAAEGVAQILKSSSYRIFDGSQPLTNRIELNRVVWNTLAIPN